MGATGGTTGAVIGAIGKMTGATGGTTGRTGRTCRSIGGHMADDDACRGVASEKDRFVHSMDGKMRGVKGACASFGSCISREATRVHSRIMQRVYAAAGHVASGLKGMS